MPTPAPLPSTASFPDLTLLPLEQPRRGWHDFISAWLLRLGDRNLLIDPGPACSIPSLIAALRSRGVESLDGILITHIHIDHSGGLGDLLEAIPASWILCHPKAKPHLIDPTKLWTGTRSVLRDLADMYGPIKPVPAELLRTDDAIDIDGHTLLSIPTPGHAEHQVAFLLDHYAFVADALGVALTLPDGRLYTRPATPPRFLADVFLASMQRLAEHPRLPAILCFGHFGWRDQPHARIAQIADQLRLWVEVASAEPTAPIADLIDILLSRDPFFSTLSLFPPDIQERERYFAANSLQGILASVRPT